MVLSIKIYGTLCSVAIANIPAEGSDRQPFGFVILEFPQRKKGTLLVPELIRWILKVFEIYAGIKGND